jgi:hypothetical protein
MGYFQTTKSQFGKILERLALEDVGIFHGHSVYFTAISYVLWPFGTICGYFGIFFPYWYTYCTKKNQFSGHMTYFIAIWYIFPPILVCFRPFWYVVPRKIWQPRRFLFCSAVRLV